MKTARRFLFIASSLIAISGFQSSAKAEYDISEYRAESFISVYAMYLSPDVEAAGSPGGGGLSFDFFFNENLGVGFAGAWAHPDVGDIWQTYTMDVTLRFPIDEGGMAPYIFVGGGAYVGDSSEMLARGGAGLDIRFLPIPLFLDWSQTFISGGNGETEPSDFSGFRFGTRLVF
jgi:hypothetical protein